MSKKTQKKTVKKTAKAQAAKSARARSAKSNKIPAAKKRTPAAGKSARTAAKPVDKPAKAKTKSAPPKATQPKLAKTSKPAPRAKSSESKTVDITASPKPTPETMAAPAAGAELAEGMKAPAFRLPRDGGETVTLAEFTGRKLVLFFYPRADTPGCTKEAIDFTRLADAFADSQTSVLGVSADPLKAQERFRDKHELKTPLMSDEQHEMLEAYGAWGEKSMYGRTFLGVMRTTVLVGEDGRIVRIWRHVKVDGHADEVLAAAKAT
jgi:thioredoxin-dependent peroxiredoxin